MLNGVWRFTAQRRTLIRVAEIGAAVIVTLMAGLASTSPPAIVSAAPPLQVFTADPGGPYRGKVGTPVVFFGSARGGTPPYRYTWSYGDGAAGQGANTTHTYGNAGSFPITLSVEDALGLDISASTTATITPPFEPLIVNPGGPYSGSAGISVVFIGSARGGSPPYRYTWNYGDGATGVGSNTTHAYRAGGNYSVTLSVGDAQGRSSSSQTTVSISQALQVNAGGPYSGITGNAISFRGSASGATSPQYLWNFGDGTSGSGASVSHVYGSPNSYPVTLTVTDLATGQRASATTGANINAPPQNLAAEAGGPYSGTAGQGVILSGSSSGFSNPQYQWTFGDGSSGNGQSLNHIYASAATYVATLTVTDRGSGRSASDTASVVIAPRPTANAGGPYSGTVGIPVTLSATSNGFGNPSYQWSFGDGGSGTGQTVTHVYSVANTFTATLTVTDLTSGQSVTAAPTIVDVDAQAQPTSAEAGGPYSGTVGIPVTFTGSSSGFGSPRYQWSFGDGGSAVGQSVNHTFAAANTYNVTLSIIDNNTGSGASDGTTAIIQPSGPAVTYPAGWNLVSAPAGTEFPAVSGALYTLQAGDTGYSATPPSAGVQAGLGYWAYFPQGSTVTLSGTSTANASVNAPAGQFVMLGNPSATQTLTVRGADAAITWDPVSGSYKSVTALTAGQGAWVFVANGGVVTISP